MTATVTATLLGTYKSIARNILVCNEVGTTSLDTITVAHQLRVCPDVMQAILRSVITNTSGSAPAMAVRAWDASQVIFDAPAGNGAGAQGARFDFICELVHASQR
mgnify:CR=1 FL=1